MVALLAACSQETGAKLEGVSVSAGEIAFLQENPVEMLLNVSAGSDWTAVAPEWIRVSPSEGKAGSTLVSVVASGNENGAERSGSLVFKALTGSAIVSVRQFGTVALPEMISVYRFLALDDDDASEYTLKGLVREIAEDESFCLVDATGTVSVPALYDKGAKVLGKYLIADGDTLTLTGTRSWDGEKVMVDGAGYVSHAKTLDNGLVSVEIGELPSVLDYTGVSLRSPVCLATSKGVILGKDGSYVFADGDGSSLSRGQTVVVTGKKKKDWSQRIIRPVFNVVGSETYTLPAPVRYNQFNIDTYKSPAYIYASFDGTLTLENGEYLLYPGEAALTRCKILCDTDLSSMEGCFVRANGFAIDRKGNDLSILVESVKEVVDGDGEGEVVAIWPLGTSAARNNYSSSWPKYGQIRAVPEGTGLIAFDHSGSIAAGTLSSNDNKLDAPTTTSAYQRYSPRAYGTFEGDFFTFTAYTPISAGEKAEIYFEFAESANCMKYWYLEYKDGEDWRPAGDVSIVDFDGKDVKYTNTVEFEKVNVPVQSRVTYLHDSPEIVFRFTAVTSICISGFARYPLGTEGVSEDRLGTSGWLMLVSSGTGDEMMHPQILKFETN